MPAPGSDLRRFLGFYYAYAFLFDFMLAYAIYTALFELEGLSVSQIGLLVGVGHRPRNALGCTLGSF